MTEKPMVAVLVGGYQDYWVALKDLDYIDELHLEKALGAYEAAVVKKEANGTVVVGQVKASKRGKAAAAGAIIGGVAGVLFPPSIVGAALVGTATGAVAGGSKKPLRRDDLKELGELLPEGGTGIVVVAEDVSDAALANGLRGARYKAYTTAEPNADSIKSAIGEAVSAGRAT